MEMYPRRLAPTGDELQLKVVLVTGLICGTSVLWRTREGLDASVKRGKYRASSVKIPVCGSAFQDRLLDNQEGAHTKRNVWGKLSRRDVSNPTHFQR